MEKPLSYNKRQVKERPSMRQIAGQFLNDELQAQLEPFLCYIEENKMPFSLTRCNTYESRLKGKSVFRVEIGLGQACAKDIYAVKVYTAVDDRNHYGHQTELIQENLNAYLDRLDEDMVDYYLNHQSYCRGCGKCKPGIQLKNIRGKTYSALCECDVFVLRVNNPTEADYEMIKRFIEVRKQFILERLPAKK